MGPWRGVAWVFGIETKWVNQETVRQEEGPHT